ncbi:MAG: ASPIC/UnbV domain-containing protein [Pirellulales bacterium]|nr:ASPIC/UnbV domain-containing protein [Pirellulales bacterium]
MWATRQVERATGEGNQNDLTLHFGLGKRTDPVDIEIRWPHDTRQSEKSDVDRTAEIIKEKTE